MDNQEYEQKKHKCWEDFCRHIVNEEEEFYNMFDRAFALGREKESITQEEIEKAAEEYAEKEMENVSSWEWDSEYVQGLIEYAWYEGANFALGKQEMKQESKQESKQETVISGWVARDDDGQLLYLYSSMPTRGINMWNGHGSLLMPLDAKLYPDLTWGDDPQEVEIIIKRKKNG